MAETRLLRQASIYGDSLMKGVVLDEQLRYHATMGEEIKQFEARFACPVRNRACFGLTIERGLQLLERDIASGWESRYALIEFGGNDCNFDWQAVAEQPEAEHQSVTPLARFSEVYLQMIQRLQQLQVRPILLNLPPLDAERYYQWICRRIRGDSSGILKWLGEIDVIYRWQESYSQAVEKIADKGRALLVDIRSRFLALPDWRKLIGPDGIHLTRDGYRLLAEGISNFARRHLPAQDTAFAF